MSSKVSPALSDQAKDNFIAELTMQWGRSAEGSDKQMALGALLKTWSTRSVLDTGEIGEDLQALTGPERASVDTMVREAFSRHMMTKDTVRFLR